MQQIIRLIFSPRNGLAMNCVLRITRIRKLVPSRRLLKVPGVSNECKSHTGSCTAAPLRKGEYLALYLTQFLS